MPFVKMRDIRNAADFENDIINLVLSLFRIFIRHSNGDTNNVVKYSGLESRRER